MRHGHVDLRDTVRLVDSRYDGTDVAGPHALSRLADDDHVVADLVDLVGLTSARERAERGDSPDFGRNVLVSGVRLAAVVNAAFAYPAGAGVGGGRFNDERVGAWYAGQDTATARGEVEHHRRRFLLDAGIVRADLRFTAYLSDLTAEAVILARRPDRLLLAPTSYVASQEFARQCRRDGVGAICYPSVRVPAGRCVAVLVPNLVQHVRRSVTFDVTWTDGRFGWVRPSRASARREAADS